MYRCSSGSRRAARWRRPGAGSARLAAVPGSGLSARPPLRSEPADPIRSCAHRSLRSTVTSPGHLREPRQATRIGVATTGASYTFTRHENCLPRTVVEPRLPSLPGGCRLTGRGWSTPQPDPRPRGLHGLAPRSSPSRDTEATVTHRRRDAVPCHATVLDEGPRSRRPTKGEAWLPARDGEGGEGRAPRAGGAARAPRMDRAPALGPVGCRWRRT
jgi:hypothetical protein